jgi:hypothetical protein
LRIKPFITDGLSRCVIRIHASDEDEIERKVELLSGPQLKGRYGGGGSKGATPINKRRSGAGSAADEDEDVESSSEGNDINMKDTNDFWDVMDDWEEKGKKRQQTSIETVVDEGNQVRSLAELKTR